MITHPIFTDFFRHFRFMPTHSLVLNLKKSVYRKLAIERVDMSVSEKTYHSFFRSLAKRCVPFNHYRRYKRQIPSIASYEVSSDHRPHLHILLKKPDHLCESTFLKLIRETAENNDYIAPTNFGIHLTDLTILAEQDRQNIIHYNMKAILNPHKTSDRALMM